ncbi:tetratricopeptide repeat protein, partial [Tropicimonas sediminicola]
ELAATDNERWSALQLMREAMKRGEADAAIRLAGLLLKESDAVSRAEALRLLHPLAERGSGDALSMMVELSGSGSEAEVFDRYAAIIDARGDFHALAFALPLLPAERREEYLDRMVASTSCDFKSALRFGEALSKIGRAQEARRWLDIAAHLAGESPWSFVRMGDSYRDWFGGAASAEMMASYHKALAAGSPVARHRLLERYARPEAAEYDPEAAAAVFAEALTGLEGEALASILGRLRGSTEDVQTAVARRVDMAEPFARAAASGNAPAMREYGLFLRDRAADAGAMTEAMGWVARAAQGGDAVAMFELSRAHAYGIGLPADAGAAGYWLSEAAVAGEPKAAELLGQMRPQQLASR